jgi:hypothetical protein
MAGTLQQGFGLVTLLDIETLDGSTYFWSDFGGAYPRAVDGVSQIYKAWVRGWESLQRTRDVATDGGTITLQNLSGNTIDRDVAGIIKAHELEGALCTARLWKPLADQVKYTFIGQLSEASPDEASATFSLRDIFDFTDQKIPGRMQSAQCGLIYKGARCGSVSAHASCTFMFDGANGCVDNGAQERFDGLILVGPLSVLVNGPGGAGITAGTPGAGNTGGVPIAPPGRPGPGELIGVA